MQGKELIIPDSPKEASLKRSYLEDKNRQKVYSISGSSSTKKKKRVSESQGNNNHAITCALFK